MYLVAGSAFYRVQASANYCRKFLVKVRLKSRDFRQYATKKSGDLLVHRESIALDT